MEANNNLQLSVGDTSRTYGFEKEGTDERDEHHVHCSHKIVQHQRVFPALIQEDSIFQVAESDEGRGIEQQPHHSVAPLEYKKHKADT